MALSLFEKEGKSPKKENRRSKNTGLKFFTPRYTVEKD